MMNMWIYLESCHVMLFPSQQKYKDLSMAKAPKRSLSVRGDSLLRASLLAIHRRGGCCKGYFLQHPLYRPLRPNYL